MRLTAFTDYSLRVLMYLGVHRDRVATIREIARAHGISENHLTKVVQDLARSGYVETIRGRGGGLRLALPPENINLADVVRDAERRETFVECFDADASQCRIAPACVLKGALRSAFDAFFSALGGYTLADLLAPRARLARLMPAVGVPLPAPAKARPRRRALRS
jgi:Rrf2 family nitric oxide-sensitive transcriptional repressor